MIPLAPFPAPRTDGLRLGPSLGTRGLALRGAVDADLPALRILYASTRAEELAPVPWPQSAKDAFIDDQFRLQHHHYVTHYPDADFFVLEAGAGIAGRFYHRSGSGDAGATDDDLVIDVSLAPGFRGQGIGTLLLRSALEHAASRGRGVALNVHASNVRARRLYERLGFAATGQAGFHVSMRCSTTPAARFS